MADKITVGLGDNLQTRILSIKPDPQHQGMAIIDNPDKTPLRGTLELPDNSVNIMLPPDSFVIIAPDSRPGVRDIFNKRAGFKTNDQTTFVLPSDRASDYFIDTMAISGGGDGRDAFEAYILRQTSNNAIVSAAIYKGAPDSAPDPMAVTPDGKPAQVTLTTLGERGTWGHYSRRDGNFILESASQEAPIIPKKSGIDVSEVIASLNEMTPRQRSALQAALDNAERQGAPREPGASHVDNGTPVAPTTLPGALSSPATPGRN
jgi:hypothetical protein